MTTLPRTHSQRYDRRVAGFRIMAGLIAIGLLLIDGIGIVAPWVDLASYPCRPSRALYRAGIRRSAALTPGYYAPAACWRYSGGRRRSRCCFSS
jgi:hypothetical protein